MTHFCRINRQAGVSSSVEVVVFFKIEKVSLYTSVVDVDFYSSTVVKICVIFCCKIDIHNGRMKVLHSLYADGEAVL